MDVHRAGLGATDWWSAVRAMPSPAVNAVPSSTTHAVPLAAGADAPLPAL